MQCHYFGWFLDVSRCVSRVACFKPSLKAVSLVGDRRAQDEAKIPADTRIAGCAMLDVLPVSGSEKP